MAPFVKLNSISILKLQQTKLIEYTINNILVDRHPIILAVNFIHSDCKTNVFYIPESD